MLNLLALLGHAFDHRRGLGLVGQAARQPGGIDPQRCQALAKFVVQLTRQPRPFVFLQGQQLLAEQTAPGLSGGQRASQVTQRGGHRLQLTHGHRRQGLNPLQVVVFDAGDGGQQPVQRR